jgi:glycine/D-amino acid oxidase-like deaminating enzyme
MHELALRSRVIWLQILQETQLPCFQTGSLHAAYREDEAAVGREFSQEAPEIGYDCAWPSPEDTLWTSPALRPDGLLGSLWSAAD